MVKIENVTREMLTNKEVTRWSRSGWCRKWSDEVMNVLDQHKDIFVSIEAREVEVAPCHWHTFVAATSVDGVEYYFDGVGYFRNGPYYGTAVEAPEYLQNSRIDTILMNERKVVHK